MMNKKLPGVQKVKTNERDKEGGIILSKIVEER